MRLIRHICCLTLIGAPLAALQMVGQQPSKPADANAVVALIEQLSSAEYKQREAATRALEGIGLQALAALRLAAEKHGDAEVRRRAKGLVEKIENSLEQLLEDYRSYGLPLPTKDAPLVRFFESGDDKVKGGEQPRSYFLGFLLNPGAKTEPLDILTGTLHYLLDHNTPITRLDPAKATAKDIDDWAANAGSDLFFLAIQCKARGWDSQARAFLERRPNGGREPTPRAELRDDAWYYWESKLKWPETDWPAAGKHMHVLIRTGPELDTRQNRALLKSLDLALLPS